MSIESRFGYGKGYTKNSQASNFEMSDASNRAAIAILKRFPKGSWITHEDCFCVDCAGALHEREAHFDAIKTAIEEAMEIAFTEGKKWESGEL